MQELPPEIWIYITKFIPDDTLRKLLPVNVFFYNIAMDMRYKALELQKFNNRTMKLLNRLADPAVGRRVRFLTVSPDFGFYGTVHAQPSMRYRFHNILHTFHLTGPALRPEEEGTHALINALPSMPNVMAFTVDCFSDHCGPELNTFLTSAWASFGSNLSKLSLRGHATSFRTIITSRPNLPMVEELFFELVDNPLSSRRREDADTLVTVVAPFINSFSSRLQAFTFWAWTSIELSALFNSLGEFPLLTCFNFHTSFPRTFTVDPTSLFNFLQRHCSQLEILVLRLNTTPLLQASSTEQRLSEWILNTFQGNHFSHLQELQLYPSALPEGFSGLLSCLQQSAETLTTLVVRERYLDAEDVASLLNHIPPNLQFLRLNLRELNVNLFNGLAPKQSQLRSLSLYIGNVSPTFIADMRLQTFNDWNLQNVGVWQSGSMASGQLMRSIKHAVPSVQSFWNLGTTDTEPTTPEPPPDWSTRIIDDGIH
ncbi:hypothetical protein GYMLUDRAFT_41280 [Collybiopsis luxurians FD-317 M1]|uniref:F-box domain-containing protein n=1 Tax=Collybiopsis luxurians FD-317 M1 TaxID=944289 RepID=A0A0D0D1H9_9AGAR|nr:hypothetical protein GYMLUDRAFT_41280 [Collybiopsis luxurians FD-317 M1]